MSGMLILVAALSMPWDAKPGDRDASLSWLTGADEIIIDDHWAGYGPASPTMADYKLRRAGGDFIGGASFSAGGHFRPKPRTDSCDVKIPAAAAADFLKRLAGCASRAEAYKPRIHHTDDYPDIQITVKAKGKSAVFKTQSQGEFHAPWAIEHDGKLRVVEGDGPGRALKDLRTHLANDRFRALIETVVAEPKRSDSL